MWAMPHSHQASRPVTLSQPKSAILFAPFSFLRYCWAMAFSNGRASNVKWGQVRRETGKEYVVQVHCDEGVATRIGPAPCVSGREAGGEASAGEHIGQPSSRERFNSERRRRLTGGRQHGRGRDREHTSGPAWSETLACMDAPCTGTGRSPVRPRAVGPVVRAGKVTSRSR
jgi:hypothetical protein